MITDKDLKKMESRFATKEDLKGFATKEDLKGFATKEDLKGFATKEDLTIEIMKVYDKIADVKETMATKDDMNRVLNGIDEVMAELVTTRVEQAALTIRNDDLDERITDIESIPAIAHDLKRKRS